MLILCLMAVFLGAMVLSGVLLSRGRKPSVRALRELAAMPVTPIAQARSGRVKLVGKARGTRHEASLAGQVPCIALRRVITMRYGNRVRIETSEWMFPFELDDGTGTISIEPSKARVDYEPLTTGDRMEECLREGATLAVAGNLVAASGAEEGQIHLRFEPPPIVTWRCDPEDAPRRRVPVLLIFAALMTLAGAAGILNSWLDGWDALDRDVLVHVAPVLALALVAGGYWVWRSENK